jgi:hypothetical protein
MYGSEPNEYGGELYSTTETQNSESYGHKAKTHLSKHKHHTTKHHKTGKIAQKRELLDDLENERKRSWKSCINCKPKYSYFEYIPFHVYLIQNKINIFQAILLCCLTPLCRFFLTLLGLFVHDTTVQYIIICIVILNYFHENLLLNKK